MERGGVFRISLFLLIFSLSGLFAHADVLVLQSGKVFRGHGLYEDRETARFRDESGVELTIKKTLLDIEATLAANEAESTAKPHVAKTPKPARPTTLAEVAAANRSSRTGRCRTFTNLDAAYGPAALREDRRPWPAMELSNVGESDLDLRIRTAEKTYARLKGQCRATGGEGTPIRHVETYLVGGKQVTVEGDWANPAAVSRAKRICAQALQAQAELAQAREELARRSALSRKAGSQPID